MNGLKTREESSDSYLPNLFILLLALFGLSGHIGVYCGLSHARARTLSAGFIKRYCCVPHKIWNR